MDFLRTPDERFERLPGYAFAPSYVSVDGLRMHYLDEGPRNAAPILLLHGEPSWSFLYRKMIPILTAAGHRVIAPDLIGFGRSDKPTNRRDYTYAGHVAWMTSFVEQLAEARGDLLGVDESLTHPPCGTRAGELEPGAAILIEPRAGPEVAGPAGGQGKGARSQGGRAGLVRAVREACPRRLSSSTSAGDRRRQRCTKWCRTTCPRSMTQWTTVR